MNKSETSKILSLLNREYRSEIIDAERTELWHEVLGNLEYKHVRAAVVKWLSDPEQAKWFPKPAQLKALCDDKRAEKLEENQEHCDRYFELIQRLQVESLTLPEERELSQLESELGISKLARSYVHFRAPKIRHLRESA